MRGMRWGSGPQFFSEGMTHHFLWQIVSAHRRSQDFQRVGARRVDPGFLVGGRWSAVGAKRRSAEGVGSGKGAVAPPRYGDLGGIAPRNFLEI